MLLICCSFFACKKDEATTATVVKLLPPLTDLQKSGLKGSVKKLTVNNPTTVGGSTSNYSINESISEYNTAGFNIKENTSNKIYNNNVLSYSSVSDYLTNYNADNIPLSNENTYTSFSNNTTTVTKSIFNFTVNDKNLFTSAVNKKDDKIVGSTEVTYPTSSSSLQISKTSSGKKLSEATAILNDKLLVISQTFKNYDTTTSLLIDSSTSTFNDKGLRLNYETKKAGVTTNKYTANYNDNFQILTQEYFSTNTSGSTTNSYTNNTSNEYNSDGFLIKSTDTNKSSNSTTSSTTTTTYTNYEKDAKGNWTKRTSTTSSTSPVTTETRTIEYY